MLRFGILGVAHVHTPSYVHCLSQRDDATLVGVYDHDGARGREFAAHYATEYYDDSAGLLSQVDAVVVCAENLYHGALIKASAEAGRSILCEKPLAASRKEHDLISTALRDTGAHLMTAFPCPFSPVFNRMRQRIESGEIGKVLAINATNRGKCPFGWFTNPGLSGGGAMIDHTVHVADLLFRLLGESPSSVTAQTGNNMYGETWEDTAHVTLDFPSGVFATLDSSWSRHQNYRTWGDVMLTVTGEKGVIEADLFGQGVTLTTDKPAHIGTGSNLDALMLDEFVCSIREKRQPSVTAEDGLRASSVALMAYESLAV